MLYLLNKEPREPVGHLLGLMAVRHGGDPHTPVHPWKTNSWRFSLCFVQFQTVVRDKTWPPSLFQMHLSEMNNFRGRSPIILNILSFWAWRLQDKRDIFCESSILISSSAAGTHSLVETYLSFKGIMKVLVKRFIFTQSRDITHILISSLQHLHTTNSRPQPDTSAK